MQASISPFWLKCKLLHALFFSAFSLSRFTISTKEGFLVQILSGSPILLTIKLCQKTQRLPDELSVFFKCWMLESFPVFLCFVISCRNLLKIDRCPQTLRDAVMREKIAIFCSLACRQVKYISRYLPLACRQVKYFSWYLSLACRQVKYFSRYLSLACRQARYFSRYLCRQAKYFSRYLSLACREVKYFSRYLSLASREVKHFSWYLSFACRQVTISPDICAPACKQAKYFSRNLCRQAKYFSKYLSPTIHYHMCIQMNALQIFFILIWYKLQ